ncbi:hypothetical protein [Neisseria mucosa]|nr:hypothetical protein [Neisseria mucosa]
MPTNHAENFRRPLHIILVGKAHATIVTNMEQSLHHTQFIGTA